MARKKAKKSLDDDKVMKAAGNTVAAVDDNDESISPLPLLSCEQRDCLYFDACALVKAKGMVACRDIVRKWTSRQVDLQDKHAAWTKAHASVDPCKADGKSEPECGALIPLRRTLTELDVQAVLLAIYDYYGTGMEKVNPWPVPMKLTEDMTPAAFRDYRESLPYAILLSQVPELRQDDYRVIKQLVNQPIRDGAASDLITVAVAVQKYGVSRTTLQRAIKDNRLTKYKKPGTKPNRPNLFSISELDREFPAK